jgi:hypothetical protein
VGVKNKQRRAAKKRKARGGGGGRPAPGPAWAPYEPYERYEPELTAAEVRALLVEVVADIWEDSSAARRCAALLLQPGRPLTPGIARAGVRSFLAELVHTVTTSGWSPTDLVEITRRRASAEHVPLLTGLLHDDAGRYAADRVPAAWHEDLRQAGAAAALSLEDVGGMQRALELLATLAQLPQVPPVLPAPGTRAPARPAPAGDHKLLTKVQALLAKAEATEYDEEAEALSAKAQELISRHSLDRLLEQADSGRSGDEPDVRRLWLEAPYVFPKAMLVHVVAEANRCRSVVTEKLGFCTLIGAAGDLDAVDVLVPSLLVQAHVAMARCGRQEDRSGTSRTRSFRQSFLLAYANRIGERLRSTDQEAAASSGRGGELVPVLARHRERVDAAWQGLFPEAVSKTGNVSNAQGWWAGRAAADQARLGTDLQVPAAEQERAAS